jgi:hypothetical protein
MIGEACKGDRKEAEEEKRLADRSLQKARTAYDRVSQLLHATR